MPDNDIRGAEDWSGYATRDYKVAVHLFQTYRPKPLEIVCFHCQQAVEKSLKAIIVLYGQKNGLPKTHDIFVLLNRVKSIVKVDEKFFEYADFMAPYGVALRYPNELFINEHHAERAIGIAKEVTEWADEIIKKQS